MRNKKFDMRAYVLVTGMNPLKIYFYKDGYVKIPVKDFSLEPKDIKDGCIHFTTSDTNLVSFGGKEYKYDTVIYDEPYIFGVMYFLKDILDLLIDNNYKVNLLELNRNPSMRGGHAVADYIYENIIADTLNIVGIAFCP